MVIEHPLYSRHLLGAGHLTVIKKKKKDMVPAILEFGYSKGNEYNENHLKIVKLHLCRSHAEKICTSVRFVLIEQVRKGSPEDA